MEADIIREKLTADRATGSGPRDQSHERTRAVPAHFRSRQPKYYLHCLVLGTIILAAFLAAWPGSHDVFRGGLAAEPADGHIAAVRLTAIEGAFHPMEAVAASLVPETPEPAPEAPPVAFVAVDPVTSEDPPAPPPPEFQPESESILAAGDVLVQDAAGQQPASSLGSTSVEPQPEPFPTAALADAPPVRVTAIGDSVMLAAASELALAIGDIEIDAEVGRVVSTAIDILRARRDTGRLGDVVLVHIGNNSPFTPGQFDEMMQVLADVSRVVVVNLTVPRDWEGPNNAVLAKGVTHYPNAVLVDWHAASVDHPQFFQDGVHLRPEGALAYAQLIAAFVGTP